MKRSFIYHLIIIVILASTPRAVECFLPPDMVIDAQPHITKTDWLIVGAGPAGLCVVGVLIDIGVNPQKITWIDPEFAVGRIGAHYGQVPANSDIREFVKFINACACFQECPCSCIDLLKQQENNNHHPLLSAIIEPLQCITQHLCTKVKSIQASMTTLDFEHTYWNVATSTGEVIQAQHVVLATGSHPKTMNYKTQQIIPLDIALDPQNLREIMTKDDIVAVVGGAHSAILLLKFLSELPIPVKHIYNFYQNPIIYATNLDGWVIDGTVGLKGLAAEWARNVLEKNPPANLSRIKSTPALLENMLPQCTKTIYAIGYDRNQIPAINNLTPITHYNPTNGLIAPRLFGIGIAFPEQRINQFGDKEIRIGLDSFMEYAQRVIPHWVNHDFFKSERSNRIQTQMKKLREASNLFSICAL
ncbi:FAD-dependent oxidoreductase [Candidatus Dependentiae bacterium]|nr:FAD-dependent oxidoreductase [Candidatus Dependentiae bacterium]